MHASGDKGSQPLAEYRGERDIERFWREVAPRREPVQRRWFLPTVLGLLVLSVPWYLPTGYMGRLFGGLPGWVWMALLCSAGISALTAFMALRHWHDDEGAE